MRVSLAVSHSFNLQCEPPCQVPWQLVAFQAWLLPSASKVRRLETYRSYGHTVICANCQLSQSFQRSSAKNKTIKNYPASDHCHHSMPQVKKKIEKYQLSHMAYGVKWLIFHLLVGQSSADPQLHASAIKAECCSKPGVAAACSLRTTRRHLWKQTYK